MTPHQKKRIPGRSSADKRGLLKDHLAASDAFARLAGQSHRLQRLQQLLDANLPAQLAPAAHVVNLKRGKVVIHADSGAVAVKLKQMGPRLAAFLMQQGEEVSGIEVKVQPARRRLSHTPRVIPKTLGAGAKRSLTSLIAGLTHESPLRGALDRLLKCG